MGVFVAAALVACAPHEDTGDKDNKRAAGRAVAYEVLAQGVQPAEAVGPSARGERIIESPDDFARAYQALVGRRPPEVDFDANVVVALYMGKRPTGGYVIEVERVREVGDAIEVRAVATQPGSGCITTQAITAPYQLVRIPVDNEPVLIERRTRRRDCD
jgi:hypothetical protein